MHSRHFNLFNSIPLPPFSTSQSIINSQNLFHSKSAARILRDWMSEIPERSEMIRNELMHWTALNDWRMNVDILCSLEPWLPNDCGSWIVWWNYESSLTSHDLFQIFTHIVPKQATPNLIWRKREARTNRYGKGQTDAPFRCQPLAVHHIGASSPAKNHHNTILEYNWVSIEPPPPNRKCKWRCPSLLENVEVGISDKKRVLKLELSPRNRKNSSHQKKNL